MQRVAAYWLCHYPREADGGYSTSTSPNFYCELCRLSRADPWNRFSHLGHGEVLGTCGTSSLSREAGIASVPTDGTSPMQSVEKSFQLTKADRDLLAKPEFEIQDAMATSMQIYKSTVCPYEQSIDLALSCWGPMAVMMALLSRNALVKEQQDSLTGCDARVFCLGVRIVKRRTVQQILNLIPKECDGERFEDAVARVCRCVGGGPATENADSDSDLELVSDSIPVNLRCPMSGSRMKIAGRFKPCAHMGCFDLEWQCPICLKNYSLESVIIDPYFTRITAKMRNCGEDITEIEVKPDGSWRAKADNDQKSLGELGQWHLPNGNLCVPMEVESKPKLEPLKQVKQEGASEGHKSLKLGIKKNRNGIWEVSKTENPHSFSSGNKLPEKNVNDGHNIIPMSSSATGSGRDGEDPSINQDGGGHFGHSTTNVADFGSLSPNVDLGYGFTDVNPHATVGDADVIILSDSDEETENLMSSVPVYNNGREDADRVAFSVLPNGISEPHNDDPTLMSGGNEGLDLFNSNDDDFGNFWNLASTSQGGPSFQLFGSDENHVDGLIDVHHGLGCSTSMDGFTLTDEAVMGSAGLVPNSSIYQSNVDMNDGLVDNPLAFGNDDPSLQLFLPTRPTETAEQVGSRDQPSVSKGLNGDDWISLSLGGGGGGGSSGVTCEPAAMNGLNSSQLPLSQNGALDSIADTASLLGGMNGIRSGKSSRERSKNHLPFSSAKAVGKTEIVSIY
ncbi:hypothetical protein OSB04_010210 [Centaurea solstitialis]|uniref:SP-RING-type domain-containing protein n=1 Tax=Centaurea solstitialis TaxID=347529 RepID=A0AA38THX7_9ASTR|nr:hypothetical protein OSB04_010210 [Centaurea solstitialis]